MVTLVKKMETYPSSIMRLPLLQYIFNNTLLINGSLHVFKMKEMLKCVQKGMENYIKDIPTSPYNQVHPTCRIYFAQNTAKGVTLHSSVEARS